MNAISGYLLKKIADIGLAKAAETLRRSKGRLESDVDGVESALDYHLRHVKNWCGEISFSELRTPKATASAFVSLSVFLHPRRRRVDAEGADAVSLEDMLTDTFRHSPAGLNPSVTPPAAETSAHPRPARRGKNDVDEACVSSTSARI